MDAGFRWVQLQVDAGGTLLAGAIAFRIFLFLLPWVFVVVMGLGIGADALHSDPRDVARSFGMAGLAATAVQSGASGSSTTRWVTFALAVVALVLGARNLIRALMVSHALIWRLPPRKVQHPTRAGLVVIGAFLVATLLIALVARVESTSPVVWLAGVVVVAVVGAAAWTVASLLLFPTAEDLTWRDVLPGSLLLGVGVEVLHLVTVIWFAPYLQSKSQTYGALGAALAILLWAYFLGRLITAAAALNAVLWRKGRGAVPPRDPTD